MDRRLLIRNGCVISMDSDVGELPRADVLIEGARIVAVGTDLEVADAEVIDADGMIVCPGLIDSHRHTWEAPVRQILCDGSHIDYSDVILASIKDRMRPQDVYAANLLGATEALDCGVTTLLDWCHVAAHSPEHADAAIEAFRQTRIRGVHAYARFLAHEAHLFPNPHPVDEKEMQRLRHEHFSTEDQLMTLALGARGPGLTTAEAVREDWRIARNVGAWISLHTGVDGVGPELRGLFARQVTALHEAGLMGPDTTYIHCCTCNDQELSWIRETGGKASIAPAAEMQMGIGVPPTGRLLSHGVRPSLSVDVVVNTPGEMFNTMQLTYFGQRMLDYIEHTGTMTMWDGEPHGQSDGKLHEGFQHSVTTRDILEFATVQGAAACGLDGRTGSITPGLQADILILRADSLSLFPLNDPIGAIVSFMNPSHVDTVLVGGQVRKRDGCLVDVDLPRIKELATEARDHMLASAGFSSDWADAGSVPARKRAGDTLSTGLTS